MTNFAGAVPGPDGQPLDRIRITGVNGRGRHGVLASERATGQEFRADVVLHLDARPAAEGDDLRATVSYADVAQEAHDVLVGEPVDLIETLAERIAAVALGHEPVQAVDVTVHKPQAPIPVSFTDVEVSIRRDRVAAPPVVGAPFAATTVPAGHRSHPGADPTAAESGHGAPEPGRAAPEGEYAAAGYPAAESEAAPGAVDPLTAPIADVATDDAVPAPGPTSVAEPAAWPDEAPGAGAPVSAEDLVVPTITPADGAYRADGFDQPAGYGQAGTPDPAFSSPEHSSSGQSEAQLQDGGMIDGVPSAEPGAPAFEPHADAPVRPRDDGSTARRPAYAAGGQDAASFAVPEAPSPEAAAPGAETYSAETYSAETYPAEAYPADPAESYPAESYPAGPYGADQGEQYQQDQRRPEQFHAEQFQPEQFQPEQFQGEQFQPEQFQADQFQPEQYQPEFPQPYQPEAEVQASYAEQAPAPYPEQADAPSYDGQTAPGFAERSGPVPAAGQGSAPEDRLDEVPAEPVEVVLALGANLGDPQATLRAAVMDLDRIGGLQITDVSPLARTAAVGGPEQPDYLNAVVVARTGLAPRALLHACQSIEYAHGRTREEHWGPRTLDIDVVTYGTLTAAADDLEVPHPRAHERAFVLEPWAQLKPDAVLPGLGGGPVAQLAATADDRQGIRWLALDWLTESNSGADPTGDVEPQPTASHRPYDPPAPQAAAPEHHAPEQPAPDRSPHDAPYPGGPGHPQAGGDPYQQVQDPFPQDSYQQGAYPQQSAFQPPQNGASAPPQPFGADAGQYGQGQASGSVPPPEEALVPAPQAPSGDHPAARAPHTPPAAPMVPSAVRETAHHEIASEQPPADPQHPVFAPVRPQPGDVPFAPVHPGAAEPQRAQPSDDRPSWSPVRTDEHGHRG